MIIALLIAIATAPVTVAPAKPNVGDHITIRMEGTPFEIRPSDDFEVVSSASDQVVLRSFRPGPLRVEYATHAPGEVPAIGSVEIEIVSVLARDDNLEPAPLRPPKPLPHDDTARMTTAIAAAVAALLWLTLALLLRRRAAPALPELPAYHDPATVFRAALAKVRELDDDESKWVALSSATRTYLAATNRSLGEELTSTELIARMRGCWRSQEDVVAVESILRGGDWTKFSPFGAPRIEITSLVDDAASLIPSKVEPEVAA